MLKASDRPATVIVAGSNGLFGLSANQMEQALGVHVINMSSHAGLQWKFIDWAVLSQLHPGDTVILPLEVSLFHTDPDDLQTLTVESAHTLGLDFFWSLPLLQKGEYLELLSMPFFRRQIANTMGQPFRPPREGYWATLPDGDLDTTSIAQNLTRVRELAVESFSIQSESGAAICDAIRRLKARGVRVIATPPNVYIKRKALKRYEAFVDELGAFYRECGAEFVLDDSRGAMRLRDMLDTAYHLTTRGKKRRTARLIHALCDQIYECLTPAADPPAMN